MFIRGKSTPNHEKVENLPKMKGLNQETHFKRTNIFREREKVKKLFDENDYVRNQIKLHQKASNIFAEVERIRGHYQSHRLPALRYLPHQARLTQLQQELSEVQRDYNAILSTVQR